MYLVQFLTYSPPPFSLLYFFYSNWFATDTVEHILLYLNAFLSLISNYFRDWDFELSSMGRSAQYYPLHASSFNCCRHFILLDSKVPFVNTNLYMKAIIVASFRTLQKMDLTCWLVQTACRGKLHIHSQLYCFTKLHERWSFTDRGRFLVICAGACFMFTDDISWLVLPIIIGMMNIVSKSVCNIFSAILLHNVIQHCCKKFYHVISSVAVLEWV